MSEHVPAPAPSCPEAAKGLAQMFMEADHAIQRKRAGNIFRQLDERTLTDEEEEIIKQRVDMQRRLFEEYEKRETARKVRELMQLCTGLTEAAAERALSICHGREDDAAVRLTSEDSFRRRVLVGTGSTATGTQPTGPKIISPSKLSGQVFVGKFRSKLGPYQVQGPSLCVQRSSSSGSIAADSAQREGTGAAEAIVDRSGHVGGLPAQADAVAEVNAGTDDVPDAAAAAAPSDGAGVGPSASATWDDGSDSDGPATSGLPMVVGRLPQRLAMFKARQLALQDVLVAVDAMRVLEAEHAGAVAQVLGQMEGTNADKATQLRTAWEVVLAMEEVDLRGQAAEPARSARPARMLPVQRLAAAEGATAAPAPGGCRGSGPGGDAAVDAHTAAAQRQQEEEEEETPPQQRQLHTTTPPPEAAGVEAAGEAGSARVHGGDSAGASGQLSARPPASPAPQPDPATIPGSGAGDALGVRTRRSARTLTAVNGAGENDPGTTSNVATNAAPRQRGEGSAAMRALAASQQLLTGSAHCAKAISSSGHTCRGRVKQKSHKRAEVIELGTLHVAKGWYNAGYIFPLGFRTRVLFRSSVDLDSLCVHECTIVGEGGAHWPAPTFTVTAADRPGEPVAGKSCTGCWSGILKRINAVITARIAAGEALPPPPRTAIAGPEYFGLNDEGIVAAIERLDLHRLCTAYWAGKEDREMAIAGVPPAAQEQRNSKLPPAAPRGGGASGKRRCRGRGGGSGAGGASDDDDGASGYRGSKWSTISRTERYRKRCVGSGDTDAASDAEAQLLPGYLDPITLEPVATPAISPAGHVMGLATWKAVLGEQQRCPFTKQPLRVDQLTVLTELNIERFRDRIVQQ